MKRRFNYLLLCWVLLFTIIVSCNQAKPLTPTPQPTSTAVSTATIVPTAIPTVTASPTSLPAASPTTAPTASANANHWWNNAVFYEVFVRSFYDGNGDGKGDFAGLTAKLDYLNDGNPDSKTSLGVKAIWLMPINPSPSYHGYDVIDYMSTNPDYGSMNEFKTFLQEAHKRGIKVILDLVLNHTSDQNPWFISSQDPKSDKRDWYIWSDTDPGYPEPLNQQSWYKTPGDGYYYAVFSSTQPDLNYRTPAVTTAMDNAISFWLKDVGIDGFRIDAPQYLIEDGKVGVDTPETHDWYKQFRTFYKAINSDAFTIGENSENIYSATSYDQGDQFDAVFAFDIAKAIVDGVNGNNGKNVSDSIVFNMGVLKSSQFGIFLTNHDINRVMSQFGGDLTKMKSAAMIYLTGPGIPFIYYGEEIGMSGQKPDEMIRTPMQWSSGINGGFTSGTPWEAVNSDFAKVNVATESADPNSLLSWYRQLVHLRNGHTAISVGDYYASSCSDSGVYASLRSSQDEQILVVSNLSQDPVNGCMLSLDKGPLKGQYKVTSLLGDTGQFADLTSNATGGFDSYQLLPALPGGANYVLLLSQLK